MGNPTITDKTCVESLKLLADYWTLRIVDALQVGELRYCQIQHCAGQVNPVTLTSRLKKLEQAGIIERRDHAQDKISVSYQLTSRGQNVLPILEEISRFSRTEQPKTQTA